MLNIIDYIHVCIIWYKLLVFDQRIIYHGVSSLSDLNVRFTVPHKDKGRRENKTN